MPPEPQDDQALPASEPTSTGSAPAAAHEAAGAPPLPATGTPLLEHVLELVRYLRVHCPWDAAQTPRSLLPYLLEEAQEVSQHVEDGDDTSLAPELGDLLLHVAFQIVLAEERAAFDAPRVVALLDDKMRRRHPHLFGLGAAEDWETLKAREREQADEGDTTTAASLLDGLAKGLDPLSRSHRMQDRVAAVGFDWPDAGGAFEKVREEVDEVREAFEHGDAGSAALEEEIGDLLFAVVNFARLAGFNAGLALSAANRKFTRRFQALEHRARERGITLSEAGLPALDELWNEVKAAER